MANAVFVAFGLPSAREDSSSFPNELQQQIDLKNFRYKIYISVWTINTDEWLVIRPIFGPIVLDVRSTTAIDPIS